MATVGQTTPTGGRTLPTHSEGGPIRRVTVPVNFTLNHIGVWAFEQTTPGDNDIRAAIYDSTGNLLYESSIVTTPLTSTSTPELVQLAFAGQALTAGVYDLAISAGGGVGGYVLTNGQNGPGGEPVSYFLDSEVETSFPEFPEEMGPDKTDDAATRLWDMYLDYSEDAGGSAAVIQQQAAGAFI